MQTRFQPEFVVLGLDRGNVATFDRQGAFIRSGKRRVERDPPEMVQKRRLLPHRRVVGQQVKTEVDQRVQLGGGSKVRFVFASIFIFISLKVFIDIRQIHFITQLTARSINLLAFV